MGDGNGGNDVINSGSGDDRNRGDNVFGSGDGGDDVINSGSGDDENIGDNVCPVMVMVETILSTVGLVMISTLGITLVKVQAEMI